MKNFKSEKNIAIIGLGYVGLPLAVKLSINFNVLGFDVNSKRIAQLKKGLDNTNEVKKKDLIDAQKITKKLTISNSEKILNNAKVFIVTVPTPVNSNKEPDLRPLEKACISIGKFITKGSIVVFESTVYPGVTEDFCGKLISKKSNLSAEKDFFLGYSPERMNPGDKIHTVDKITKVISATTPKALKTIEKVYSSINNGNIFRAKSIKVAEASKVIENSQRDINIAFINEITKISQKLNISIYDVLEASLTKWNFLPFQPGLVGGHCIGVDPYYIAYKSKSLGIEPKVILSGRSTNDEMSKFLSDNISKNIKKNSRILILGITFKENVPDIRNSKVFDLVLNFKSKGHKVTVTDPMVKKIKVPGSHFVSFNNLKKNFFDVLVLAVGHDFYLNLYPSKVNSLLKENAFIADLKGIWRDKKHIHNYWTL